MSSHHPAPAQGGRGKAKQPKPGHSSDSWAAWGTSTSGMGVGPGLQGPVQAGLQLRARNSGFVHTLVILPTPDHRPQCPQCHLARLLVWDTRTTLPILPEDCVLTVPCSWIQRVELSHFLALCPREFWGWWSKALMLIGILDFPVAV